MAYTDARNGNKRTLARMRAELEEWRQQARLQKMAISDQAIQRSANTVPLSQRRPWWWRRHVG
jgi:hypothetical protein